MEPKKSRGDDERQIDSLNLTIWDELSADPEGSAKKALAALERSVTLRYRKGQADAWLNVGWARFYESKLPEAYGAFGNSLRLYEELGDFLGSSAVLNAIGVYDHTISRLDKALEYYTRSMEAAKAAGSLERELVATANIGEVCLDLGNPKEALDYLVPAYDRMPEGYPARNVSDCLRNIGQAYLMLGTLDLATEFSERAYEAASASCDPLMSSSSLESLAAILLAKDDAEGALARLAEARAIVDKVGNRSQLASLLVVEGQALVLAGRLEEAIAALTEAESMCAAMRLQGKLYRVYEHLSAAWERKGDPGRALEYFKRYSVARFDIQSEDTAFKMRRFRDQANIEQAQREAEIYRLRNIDLKEKTEALEESNRQIMAISEIGKRITASLDFNTVVQTVHDCLKPHLDIDMFGIALADAERSQLVYRRFFEEGVRRGERRIAMDSKTSFAAWSFRNRKPVLIAHNDTEYSRYLEAPAQFVGRRSQSIVCMPLAIEDKPLGVMTVQNYEPKAYSPQHLSLLEALCSYVAIAVDNAIVHDRVEDLNRALSEEKRRLERATLKISHLANHDTLTGLPNRRLLFELAGKAIETVRRSGSILGVVYIDLDDFKPINDRFGHSAGDSALIAITERLRSLVRASDIVARIGGDEFVAIVNNVKNRADIERVATKLLDGCGAKLELGSGSCSIGLSMGIAVFPDHGSTVEELINKADAAMYRVKHVDKRSYAFFDPAYDGLAMGEPADRAID